MKKIYASILTYCLALSASAQFTGDYAPGQWNIAFSPGNGSVNTSGAPSDITITGNNDATNADTDFIISAASSGSWSFTWTYHSNDANGAQNDIAGVLVNGVFTPVINSAGGVDQSGTFNGMEVTTATVIGFRVSATNNANGSATFTISNFSPPGSTLALTLTNFRAKQFGEKVLLNWSTRDERNMAGFTIERSANGRDFQQVGFTAARNQHGTQTYETTDATPVAGTSYYRLRIKELNGTEKTSAVVSIKSNAVLSLQLSPNPAKDFVRITFQSGKAGRERIDVLDAGGRVLQSSFYEVKVGQQTVTLNQLPLSKGLYYVRASDKVVSFIKE